MELVVLSGKGGTGKTTVSIALSELMESVTRVDCDVDASNMHLYYDGSLMDRRGYLGNEVAFVDESLCNRCGLCTTHCKFNSIDAGRVNQMSCEGCGACKIVCPKKAIRLKKIKTADILVKRVHNGKMVYADMKIGSEGSGKLIAELKRVAREHTDEDSHILIDGSPGIGCPVISSITGSDLALLVVEPTLSGYYDFIRVKELCDHFGIKTMVCINKYDINEEISKDIESYCEENEVKVVGRIPFDHAVLRSIEELVPVVKYTDSMAGREIVKMSKIIEEIKKLEEI